MFDILSHYVPESQFNFYRYIGGKDKEDRLSGDLLNAVRDANTHGVDVLNVSGGVPIPEYDPESPRIAEVEKCLRQELTIVSACGNRQDGVEEVTYPSIIPDVIGVSGYEPICEGIDRGELNEFTIGRYSVDLDEIPVTLSGQQGPYCGYVDFHEESGSCETFPNCILQEEIWSGNVQPNEDQSKPDVYSPVMYPNDTLGNVVKFDDGTSFAAPIITALLTRVLSVLDSEPSAKVIRKALKKTGVQLDSTDGVKPIADDLFEYLKSEQVREDNRSD